MPEEARTILDENLLGSVATINEDGSPWSTPIHVFSDDEAVYWFSNDAAQHSRNVAHDPRVCVTLFAPDTSKGPKGVYISGNVEVLDVDTTTKAKQLIEARIGKIPPNFVEAIAYRVKIGSFNSSKSFGNCWYFYT